MRFGGRFRLPLPKVDFVFARVPVSLDSSMDFYSGAATTASRMGQPDLAIATLNDFVGVNSSFLL